MSSRLQHRRRMEAGIFDAAIRLFDDRGYDDTSVEEICAEAQVGRATFFRYFETKAGLIREVDERVAAEVIARLRNIAEPSFVEMLQIVADALHNTWSTASPGLRALGRESSSVPRPSRRVFANTLEVALEVIRAARSRGDLQSELPPHLIAYAVLMQLTGAVGWWIDNPDTELRTLLDGTMHHCLAGYAAPAPFV